MTHATISALAQLIVIGLTNGAVIGLNAIAVTLIYGVVRTINLAHGDIFALLTVFVATLITWFGLNVALPAGTIAGGVLLSLGASVFAGAALSGVVERMAFKPFRDRDQAAPLGPLLATLGISFMLYQFALSWRTWLPSWTPGEHRSVPGIPELPRQSVADVIPDIDFVEKLGIPLDFTFTLKDLLVLIIAAACAVGVLWLIRRSKLGRAIRAVSQDPGLAQLVGVHADRVFLQVFVLGGALAGVAAFVFTSYYTHPFSNHGAQSGLIALAAAILGGVGNPAGALLAGLLIGVVSAFSDYFWKAQWTPVLVQLLLIVLLIVRPRGFGGDDRSEEASAAPSRLNMSTLLPGHIRRPALAALAALFVAALVYPPVSRWLFEARQETVLTTIMILVIMALGLNVLLGFAGVLDLGFAVSFGIGAYTAAFLTDPYGAFATWLKRPPGEPIDFLVVVAVSAATAALFGVLNGLLTLRVKADYLAIVTLAFGQMSVQVINNLGELTGGFGGISALPPPRILGYSLAQPLEQYYLVLGCVALLAVASQRVIRSRLGRGLTAMGIDEVAAVSCGVDPSHTRITAFAISTAFAGIAGALFANTATFISPELTDFPVSSQALAMVIVGGAGSVPGTIFGAFVVAGYDRIVIPAVSSLLGWLSERTGYNIALDVRNLNYFSFGLALYLTVLLRTRPRRAK